MSFFLNPSENMSGWCHIYYTTIASFLIFPISLVISNTTLYIQR
jgi:hypothetical protein